LKLEPEGYDARDLPLPAPTREVKTLLTLVRLDLEARQPGAPVAAFTLTAHPDRPRQGQLTLFGPAEISPDRPAPAAPKRVARLGEGPAGAAQEGRGPRPGGRALMPAPPPPAPRFRKAPRPGRGLPPGAVPRPAPGPEVITNGSGPGAPADSL